MKGYRSHKWGHLGVHFLCTGPDPSGPRPGPRLQVVIYDGDGNVTRRLEQVGGGVIQEGYVDFFGSTQCCPSVREYHLVDTNEGTGERTVLATHTTASGAHGWLRANFGAWAQQHGVGQ